VENKTSDPQINTNFRKLIPKLTKEEYNQLRQNLLKEGWSVRTLSVYREKRTKHSKKPDYYYRMIGKMFPNGKYLELFARKKFNSKWTVYGNEI